MLPSLERSDYIYYEVVRQPERIGKSKKFNSVLATMVSAKKLGAVLLPFTWFGWDIHTSIFIYLLPTGSAHRH